MIITNRLLTLGEQEEKNANENNECFLFILYLMVSFTIQCFHFITFQNSAPTCVAEFCNNCRILQIPQPSNQVSSIPPEIPCPQLPLFGFFLE